MWIQSNVVHVMHSYALGVICKLFWCVLPFFILEIKLIQTEQWYLKVKCEHILPNLLHEIFSCFHFSLDDELHTATMLTLQNTLWEASNGNLTVDEVFAEMCTYLKLPWWRVSTVLTPVMTNMMHKFYNIYILTALSYNISSMMTSATSDSM